MAKQVMYKLSILGTIYDHTKGERKIKGRSKEFRG